MGGWKMTLTLTLMVIMKTVTGLWLPHLIDENSEHVELQITERDADQRQRRSAQISPTGVNVTLIVEGRSVALMLRRIADSDARLPVHVLRNGTLVDVRTDASRTYSFYEDETRDALILLQGISKESFSLFGTFKSGSDRYLVQQSTNSSTENSKPVRHAVTKLSDKTIPFNDDVIYPVSLLYKKHTEKRSARSKRQTQTYVIELYIVIDYSLYAFWYKRTSGSSFQRDQKAKENIQQFYTYVLYGIDQRYRGITGQTYTIRVASPGLLILDNPSDAPMTENNKVSSSPRDILGSSTVLDDFHTWENGQSGLPQRDHTMLFTHYDIVSSSSSGGDSAGIAFVGTLCTNQAQSVIEDGVSPFTMTTAAHELGHSLSADHDGYGNLCSSSDNYIMASVNTVVKSPELMEHMWIFSSCSVAKFTTYINKLNGDSANCMTATSPSSAFPSINQPMADVYSADEMCALSEGEGSYVCRSIQDYSSLCATMFCNVPGTSQCYSVMPPEGISCGNKKICQKGRCITSSNAPSVPDNCPLGDQRGVLSDFSQTCADYVADNPYRCYPDISSYVSKSCCGSCAAIHTGVQGCEYGDKAPWCKTMDRFQCYVNADTCCDYCNRPGVKDATRPGCEYGDHFSNCNKDWCEFYDTASKEGCCETCGTPVNTTTTTTTRQSSTSTTTKSSSTTSTSTTSTTSKTSKITLSTEKTTRKTTFSGPSSSTTAVPIATEAPSDSVIIGIGVGVGLVLVIIIIVIIVFICYKRKHKYIRKHSKSSNNAYDNIGFVKPSRDNIPHHPPPRRDNSVTAPVRPPPLPGTLDRSPLRPPNLNFQPSGSIAGADPNEIDGYMTPNGVKVKTVSNGVQYTAPDKPKFNFNVLNGAAGNAKDGLGDKNESPRTPRKPKHYRRSAASNSSNEVDTSGKESRSNIDHGTFNTHDFTGNKNDMHENGAHDNAGLVEGDTYNEISEVGNKFEQGVIGKDKKSNFNDTKPTCVHQPKPKPPPMPKPRIPTNDARDLNDSRPKVPLKPKANHSESSELKSTLDKLLAVDSRDDNNSDKLHDHLGAKATDNDDNHIGDKSKALKPPLRPPMKPVPRRQQSDKNVHENPAFEEDSVVII